MVLKNQGPILLKTDTRRAHRTYASRYLQGLLNDSPRKSMKPMNGPASIRVCSLLDLKTRNPSP